MIPGTPQVRVLRVAPLQLPHHVRLGRDEELGRLRVRPDVLDHRLGAADEVRVLEDVLRALRVRDRLRLRVLLLHASAGRATLKISWTMHDPSHRIISRPVTSWRYAAEVLVRHEQDFVARRHLVPHHVLGVART